MGMSRSRESRRRRRRRRREDIHRVKKCMKLETDCMLGTRTPSARSSRHKQQDGWPTPPARHGGGGRSAVVVTDRGRCSVSHSNTASLASPTGTRARKPFICGSTG